MYQTQQEDESRALTLVTPRVQLDKAQLAVLGNTIARGLTGPELAFFGHVCQRMQLDPFARQIYAVKRGEGDKASLTIQIGIDGFRALAERTGLYRGQIGPLWCGADGEWVDAWLSDTAPVAAKVGILRADFSQPVFAVARTKAYAQERNALWRTMPEVMVAKCAEALALRKAFPDALSGAYEPGEMEQAGMTPPASATIVDEAEDAAARVAEAAPHAPKPVQPTPADEGEPPWVDMRARIRAVGMTGRNDVDRLCKQVGVSGGWDEASTWDHYHRIDKRITALETAKASAEAKLKAAESAATPASNADTTADFPADDTASDVPGARDMRELPVPAVRP